MTGVALRASVYFLLFVIMALFGSALVRHTGEQSTTSNDFWALVDPQHASGPAYGSVEELAAHSDLIVVARVDKIERGREWVAIPALKGDPIHGDAAYARFGKLTLHVEQSLGHAALPNPLEIEISVVTWDHLTQLQDSIPSERSIFFLRQKQPPDDPRYFRLTTVGDAVIRDVEGKAESLLADSRISREIANQEFAAVVESVSQLASN